MNYPPPSSGIRRIERSQGERNREIRVENQLIIRRLILVKIQIIQFLGLCD